MTLPADRAVVRVGIATRAATAAAATALNGPLVTRLQDTLAALGLDTAAVRAIAFTVVPNYEVQNARRINDYEARTTIEVTDRNLPGIGGLLDAILAAGATDIASITFDADGVPAARVRALAAALQAARADAEALAAAASGRLGTLLLATTSPTNAFQVGRSESVARSIVPFAPTIRRDVVVAVVVQARWALIPTP